MPCAVGLLQVVKKEHHRMGDVTAVPSACAAHATTPATVAATLGPCRRTGHAVLTDGHSDAVTVPPTPVTLEPRDTSTWYG